MEDENKVVGEVIAEQKQTEEPVRQQTSQEINLVAMRKKLEAEERARIEAERRANDLEQRMQNYHPVSQKPDEVLPEEDGLADNDDYVQVKHIKTSNKKFTHKLSATDKKIAELEQKLAYVEAKSYTDSLKDFDQIVNEENIKTLARLYPEDYEVLQSNNNLRVKSKAAYNMIKNYGIAGQAKDSHSVDQRIASNNQKPKLASSGSPQTPQTPLSRLDEYGRRVLSEADRDRILAEVERKKAGR